MRPTTLRPILWKVGPAKAMALGPWALVMVIQIILSVLTQVITTPILSILLPTTRLGSFPRCWIWQVCTTPMWISGMSTEIGVVTLTNWACITALMVVNGIWCGALMKHTKLGRMSKLIYSTLGPIYRLGSRWRTIMVMALAWTILKLPATNLPEVFGDIIQTSPLLSRIWNRTINICLWW